MKQRTRIVLVGVVLLALAMLSSARRGAASKQADGSIGACCPLIQSLNEMSVATGTNATVPIVPTNKQPATDHP